MYASLGSFTFFNSSLSWGGLYLFGRKATERLLYRPRDRNRM